MIHFTKCSQIFTPWQSITSLTLIYSRQSRLNGHHSDPFHSNKLQTFAIAWVKSHKAQSFLCLHTRLYILTGRRQGCRVIKYGWLGTLSITQRERLHERGNEVLGYLTKNRPKYEEDTTENYDSAMVPNRKSSRPFCILGLWTYNPSPQPRAMFIWIADAVVMTCGWQTQYRKFPNRN